MTHVLGTHERVVRARSGSFSFRFHRRTAVVCGLLGILLVAVVCASLVLGDYVVTPVDAVRTLFGDAPDKRTEFFVVGRRLPRVLVALAVGALLALAGALFQMLTRNPLASPDVIGVSSGASVGAVVVMLLLGGTLDQASLGAAVGAVAAALLLVTLTLRTGLGGVQLILVGVAISAMAMAAVDYILSQVFVASAVTAQTWLVGSLQGRNWSDLVPAAVALAIATPLLMWKLPAGKMIGLGDDLATGLGVKTSRTRWQLIAVGTLLVAVAVATAGPVSFVALIAPHIARSLTRENSFLAAALTGAALLAISDLTAMNAFPAPIPVGAVTITAGGAFFLWLLWREGRRRV